MTDVMELLKPKGYEIIHVESYRESGSGLHGDVHVRPLPKQSPFKTTYRVARSYDLINKYPVGTKFRIYAKLIYRQGTPIVYSNYKWPYEVLK